MFIAYLIDRRQPEVTIRSYTSGIKSVLKKDGIIIDNNSYLLASLLKACKYVERDRVCLRLPIHRGMMRLLVDKVDRFYQDRGQPYLVKLYKAMMMTAYYGLFRIGEITQSNNVIKYRNVHTGRGKDKVLFVLWSSKTQKQPATSDCEDFSY